MSLVAHKYTPAEMSEQELQATFAARGHTVDYLLKSLRDQIHSGTLSSFVITGPRGAGKSTVIHMVALRLRQDAELNAAWLPVVFPEEQFNIGSLRDLLAATLQTLVKDGISPAQSWLKKVEAEANDEQSLQLAMTGLREVTRQTGKRLVLFVENLNRLMEEELDGQMKGTLRRLLMSDPFMLLIGSAVHVFDSLKSYDEAFFNYFGQVPLGRLSVDQVGELLRKRAEFDGNTRFLRDFPKEQAKVRALVHLTGGNPRLVLMLYELLSEQQVTTIVMYLRRLVDELTPLLKHETENLPPQQRKIIHALMEKGGTAQPTDLVGPTRLPLNAITTQLKRLKDAQFLEVLGGGKGRAANYTVPDKLFAIWYQMRYLDQNRRRIELFVEVLRIWFEEEERMETLRKLSVRARVGEAQELKDCAVTGEYLAASLKGTQYEHLAARHCLDLWVITDMDEATLAYADFYHLDERQAQCGALYTRALARTRAGQPQEAVADLSTIIELEGAPDDVLAPALVGRGLHKGGLGDVPGAVTDFNAAIKLEGAPKKQLAIALLNRGVAKFQSGDLPGAVTDYTAVIEMDGAPKESVAKALLDRGLARFRLRDLPGQIDDHTAVIENGITADEVYSNAIRFLLIGIWIRNDKPAAKRALTKFAAALGAVPRERACAVALRFLGGLAAPGLKETWTFAWHTLAEVQQPKAKGVLDFLEPVCKVLEGQDRKLLDALPPEEREFAETVLAKFEPKAKLAE